MKISKDTARLLVWGFLVVFFTLLVAFQTRAEAKKVTLQWDYSEEQQADILGFKLYRTTRLDTDGQPDFAHQEAVVEEIAADMRRHTTEDLAPGLTFYWTITAHDEDTESGPSNTVSYTTPDPWQPGMEVLQMPPPSHP